MKTGTPIYRGIWESWTTKTVGAMWTTKNRWSEERKNLL